MSKARSADKAEDAVHGPDARGDELPEESSRRQGRLARIQESKRALEEAAQAAAQTEEEPRCVEEEARREAGESSRTRKPVDPAPAPKAQRNFTDPGSKIMNVSNEVSISAATLRQWPMRSRSSARSNRSEVLGSACCADWQRCMRNGV